MLPLITLEEHYVSPVLFDSGIYPKEKLAAVNPTVHKLLSDTGPSRIANMDKNSIAIQVISHIPIHPPKDAVIGTNDSLAKIVRDNPARYAGFALLSVNNPSEAAEELERAVKELGFVGALIGSQLEDGRFYDTPEYEVLFKKAQDLDVPIYFHPAYPSDPQFDILYNGPYPKSTGMALGCWCWGWHSMTGLHILRLFAAGVFDKFPRLKIIIGHMGEMLPFMLDRIIGFSKTWPDYAQRTKGLRDVWNENIWVTTSGMFSLAPMKCLLEETKRDRIMFSIDYPLAPNEPGVKFIEDLKESGLVTQEELEGIAYKNAAKLLGLKVRT